MHVRYTWLSKPLGGYMQYQGVMKRGLSRVGLAGVAAAFAFVLAMGVVSSVSAISPAGDVQFTQAELDTNWEADRQFPSDGATSVSAFGRDDVARLGIDSSATESNTFRRTEGIKTVGAQNFGDTVQADLYVDSDWEDKAARAGVWVVGDDGAGARDNIFGIIEFVNLEPSTSGDSAQGDHEGWRYWTSADGWTNLDTEFEYGKWATLNIELDASAAEYKFTIDGEQVATGPGGENFIREVFLNSYNYGMDEFPVLSNDSYAAHWHGGIVNPDSKGDCKKGGWSDYGFRNQGQCIKYVNTGKDSR